MRDVCEAPGHRDAFLADMQGLSPTCATSVFFYIEALETEDPEIARVGDEHCELCGTIDLHHEVFCAKIPGCRSHRLVLTIDRSADTVFVHSVLKGADRNCAKAYEIAATQLNLSGKPWEQRHGRKT